MIVDSNNYIPDCLSFIHFGTLSFYNIRNVIKPYYIFWDSV